MDSRVQENRRLRHEVGVAVTDHGFPATFIKDGLGSASMERTPRQRVNGENSQSRCFRGKERTPGRTGIFTR